MPEDFAGLHQLLENQLTDKHLLNDRRKTGDNRKGRAQERKSQPNGSNHPLNEFEWTGTPQFGDAIYGTIEVGRSVNIPDLQDRTCKTETTANAPNA